MATTELPVTVRDVSIGLLDANIKLDTVRGQWKRISPCEFAHAAIKRCYQEMQQRWFDDRRAKEWLRLFQSCPFDFYRLAAGDFSLHNFSFREMLAKSANAIKWTLIQRVQLVIRERAMMQVTLKKLPSAAQVAARLGVVQVGPESEKITFNFVDIALTAAENIFSDQVILNLLEWHDVRYDKNGPLGQITKWQTIMNRGKSEPGNIRWIFQHICDALRMGFYDPGELSVLRLNTVVCEVALLKKELLCLLWDRFAEVGMSIDDQKMIRELLASHESCRNRLTNYPDVEEKKDIERQYFFMKCADGTLGRRGKSFELALELGETAIYGKELEGCFKTAVKYSKSAVDMLWYSQFEEDLRSIEEEVKKEKQALKLVGMVPFQHCLSPHPLIA